MTAVRARSTLVAATCGSIALVAALSARRLQPPQSPPATARVAGVVVGDSRTHKPVPDALVLVAGIDVSLTRVVSTDSHGRFDCAGLPHGRYLLAAGKPDYIAAMYGAHSTGQAGDIVALTAGEFDRDLTIVLARGASVSGRVTDDAGDPVSGVRVRVLPRRAIGDEIALGGDAGDPQAPVTDDLGAYRVYDLPPGSYVVATQSRGFGPGDTRLPGARSPEDAAGQVAAPPGTAVGAAPMFWPGTTDVAGATAIQLAVGEDRAHIDLHVPIVRFARLDGTIRGRATGPVQVTLRPRGWRSSGVALFAQNTRADAAGRFAFTNVPPGDYTIAARTVPTAPSDAFGTPDDRAPVQWALDDVTVHGADEAIALDLQRGLDVSGRVTFAGLPKPPSDITVRIGLRPTPAAGGPPLPAPAAVGDDGRFHLTGVVPGPYWIVASIPTDPVTQFPDWIAGTAVIDGADAFDDSVTITHGVGEADLAVTLTRETQQIDGTVRDAGGRPAADCPVLIFTTDSRRWVPQSRRISLRRTDDAGALLFNVGAALPPGDYFVAAVPGIRPGEEFDPAFLASASRSATRISLAPGGSRTVSLRLPRNDR